MNILQKALSIILILLFSNTNIVLSMDHIPTDDEINNISKDLYCPVCENTPLDACGTQACIQWRNTIGQLLSEGWSPDEIKTYFVTQYGIQVLSEPPKTGFHALLWLLPLACLLIGLFILIKTFSSKKSSEYERPSENKRLTNPNDYHINQIEKDLQQWK
ncbi:MAG TPA: hypothetical protein DGM69_02160 [Chloroflexi bacterium]|nr:hypothetical protein [Chloroflexota bacterium]